MPPITIPSDPLARQRRKLELKRRLAVLRDAERLEQSFKAFVIDAWPVIEPGRPLAWNWHLDILCETLEAIARGEVRRAVINVPPRTMKSTLFNVMFPAWVWCTRPAHQFLNISTDADLAMRDSTVSRVIIQSDWYQQRWGRRFKFSADQNQKSWYKNDQNGHRQALGMTSKITGKGADTIIIDDPHNVSGAQSDAERKADTAKYDNEIQNRLNDQATGSIIIIMQRLHEQDLTGHVLPRGGWLHLCFPMEYDAALATEGVDERTEHGALLWPERFPRRSIDELKASMTPYAYSGQYQQRPTPAEGGILKRAWWNAWPKERALPPCAFIIQCWDGAFDAKTANDYTACTTWGVFKNEQTHRHNLILLERFRQRVEFPDLRMRAKELYDKHDADLVLIEPKATGKPLVQELRRAGVPVQEWQPERGAKGREVDKTARTHAAAIVPWGGAVWYPVKRTGEPFGWVNEVIEECASFPNAAHDDLVDTCFLAGTMIVTASGLTPIEGVRPGDLVLTHLGRFRRVTRAGSRMSDHVYKIKAKTLDAVYVTGEHPFWTLDVTSPGNGARSTGSARWVDAADLRQRPQQAFLRKGRLVSQPRSGISYDALTLPRLAGGAAKIDLLDFCDGADVGWSDKAIWRNHGKAKPVHRRIVLDRDFGWLCGLFLAEGHSDGAGHIRWSCDRQRLREAERIIADKFGADVSWYHGRKNSIITLSRSILTEFFAKFGHLAENKIVPAWAMDADGSFAQGLVDGMAAGDGHHRPDGRVRITTTSQALAWQARLLLGKAGVHATVACARKAMRRAVMGRECDCLDVYTVDYRINAGRSVAVWGPAGEAGYWIEEHCRSNGEYPVYNLSVDEDESYVTTGGAVHNCTMAWLYLRRSWWADLSDEEVDERKDEEEEAYEDDKIRSYG